MIDHKTLLILTALIGFLSGLLIAEYYYHKARVHSNHVMPATIIRNDHHVFWQKFWYYNLFLTLLFADYVLKINLPKECYYLDVFFIGGGDAQKLFNKFVRAK